jgi:hypothetical protein
MEGQPGDWEARLSRRAALRRDALEERQGGSSRQSLSANVDPAPDYKEKVRPE